MIGYKATDKNGCCRGFKFEVGKTYTKDTPKEELKCCTDKVFHFCRELFAIERESDYKLSESRIFEVIAGDYVRRGDKYGTNSLTILREIEGDEKQELINSGNRNVGNWNSGSRNSGNCNSGDCNSGNFNSRNCNSGNCNSGDRNSGNCNSGDRNSGNYNSGNYNSGNWNSGDCNSGNFNSRNCNSGNFNSGNWNSGNFNSGDCNSRNWNSGDCNSGNWNSGNFNSGNWNSGNRNSGNWNSGNRNSGYFNTNEPPVRIFNAFTEVKKENIVFPKFLYFDLTVWVSYDTATEEEKTKYKAEIETCGGFLKTLEYKEAFRRAWDKASKEEHKKLLNLPNWNNDIFKEISGIDAEAEIAKEEEDESN